MGNAINKTRGRNPEIKESNQKVAPVKEIARRLRGRNLAEGIAKAATVGIVSLTLATGCWAGAGIGGKNAPDEGKDTDPGGEIEGPEPIGVGIFAEDACEENYIEPNSQIGGANTLVMDGKGDFGWDQTVWADAETAAEYMESGIPEGGYWTVSHEFAEVNNGKGIPETTDENPGSRMDRRMLNLHFDLGQWLLVKLSHEENVVSLGKTAAQGSVNVGEEMGLPDGKTVELVGVSTELNENGEHNVVILVKDAQGEPLSEPITVAPGEVLPIEGYWIKANSSIATGGEKKAYLFLLSKLRTLEGGNIEQETGVRVELDWDTGDEYPVLKGFEVYSC